MRRPKMVLVDDHPAVLEAALAGRRFDSTSRRWFRASASALCLCVALIGAGCTFSVPERKLAPTVHAQSDVAVTPNQLRLRMRSLVGPMSGEIEQAADHIIASATNERVKRAALLWKIEGVPALREALFDSDPFTALMDTWVLINQMADYFERGPGTRALGESAAVAVAVCRRMEEDFARVASSMTVSGDVSKARSFARTLAAEHPIRHAITDRENARGRILERNAASFHSTGEIVEQVTTTMDDLNRRLELYSSQLFRQTRWEAELFKSDMLSDLKMNQILPLAERAVNQVLPLAERTVHSAERAVTTVDRLAPAVERALGVVEGAPQLLRGERDAVSKAVRDELTRTIEAMRGERIAALEYLTKERTAALEYLTKERIAALSEMREALLAERKGLTLDIEHITLKVVDHAFLRAAQLLALLCIALFIALVVCLFALKRSRPATATTLGLPTRG